MLFVAALCGSCAGHGCRGKLVVDEAKKPEVQHGPTRTLPSPSLKNASAFELVATSEGALLIWAPDKCDNGLLLRRFDADGVPLGEPVALAACAGMDRLSEVTQVAAVAAGGKLGLAWIVRNEREAQAFGSFGEDSATSLAAALPLGAAEPARVPARAQLLLSGAETGQVRVELWAPTAACTGQSGRCAQVIASPLPPAREAAARRTDGREVPHPCPRLLVGSAWNHGIWYDAFCALDAEAGRPTTQVYAVRPEIFYAEALPTLQGCTPLGVAPSERGVLVLGACQDGLYAHLLSEAHRSVLARIQRSLRCEAGRPILEIRSDAGGVESYKLSGPRDRIELWLPETLAAEGSRAAFTGRSLLIATVQQQQLVMSRQHCEGETLVSDTRTML